MLMDAGVSLGAVYLGEGRCRFEVWAPLAERVAVHVVRPRECVVELDRRERGYYRGVLHGVEPGSRYFYLLDGKKERPDPASRYQPEGVHGPSQVVDGSTFVWSDAGWSGVLLPDLVIYELHVGTFTPEGTFTAAIPHLWELKKLGVTAVEIMPVAQFPGHRNWGYDGVYPFAVQNTYGGPDGLRQLVDACHGIGLAVILDVVYNHLGLEGNYLAEFAPYFSERYTGSWGPALNFDGPGSDEVRRFFVENALYWLTEFHVDGLRLDAVHGITDMSARPFLQELADAVRRQGERLGRVVHVIAESDLNDPRVINPPEVGGYGIDAQWCDDFHHALHSLLTGERRGYYRDFGKLEHLARAFRGGYVYTGQYSAYRQRRHGSPPRLSPARRFVVFAQNHDQVGNRARGERLASLVSFAKLKLAACAVLLSPFIPLLFMGEEYGELAPFLYFTSYSDPELAEAVRRGRREEFADFAWEGQVPDPQAENTFTRSRLNRDLRQQERHRVLYRLYRQLLRLRRDLPALADMNRENLDTAVLERERVLLVRRWSRGDEVCMFFSFGDAAVEAHLPLPAGHWCKKLDTGEEQWLGGGTAVPKAVDSPGILTVTLEPGQCVLWQRVKED